MNTHCSKCGHAGYVANFGDLPNTVPDARFGSVQQYANSGISNYNGLTVSLNQSIAKGLQFVFNNTYSHCQDDVSNGGLETYSFSGSRDSIVQQMDPYYVSKNYGNSTTTSATSSPGTCTSDDIP